VCVCVCVCVSVCVSVCVLLVWVGGCVRVRARVGARVCDGIAMSRPTLGPLPG
jgi:hypothetical protein